MLNLKSEVLQYSITMKSVMKEPLINLINEQIYYETDTWSNGAIAAGEDLAIRSVKVRGLLEEDIGTSGGGISSTGGGGTGGGY